MNVAEIKVEIAGVKEIDGLRDLRNFITTCMGATAGDIKRKLRVGSKVRLKDQFCTGRKGSQLLGLDGEVTKLNPKRARVDFGNFRVWTVSYSMLDIA